ncbi:MAG: hypothetical protein LBH24_00995 [Clostridiales bacterium]|jgi:hypothetical protein|nr:hypothetical protein [Clostridiales bacterium]
MLGGFDNSNGNGNGMGFGFDPVLYALTMGDIDGENGFYFFKNDTDDAGGGGGRGERPE